MRRHHSRILFGAIALLLAAKTALNFWPSMPEAPRQMAAEAVEASALGRDDPLLPRLEAAQSAADSLPAAVEKPVRQQEQPATFTAEMLRHASLATLQAYLIPAANAAASPTEQAIMEDKTLASLRQYRDQLDERAARLDKQAAALKAAEEQLQQRITELEQLEASIQQRLADESKIKNKKIKRLTAVYEGMKPDKAAPVIAQMELATVVKIFLLMDEKKVGKILSFLPPEKAVRISQALTRQISTVK